MNTGLLLRQKVPVDKERITFNRLEDIDDMWIWLYRSICRKLGLDHSEVWMWGGVRSILYEKGLIENWYQELPTDIYYPDLIFSRGGFAEYLPVMANNPQAFKIYYGAIYKDRLNPRAVGDNTPYNIVLADNDKQLEELSGAGYRALKFLKPACEQIFKPVDVEKKYDVLFVGNAKQKAIKGHEWLFNVLKNTGWSILQIGNTDEELISLALNLGLDITFIGWIPRKEIPALACQAKVGVCCSVGDSCPRVIPEMLAMGIPVVVKGSEKLFIWEDYFKNVGTRRVTSDSYFIATIKLFLEHYHKLNTRRFYDDNFSINKCADNIVNEILLQTSGI